MATRRNKLYLWMIILNFENQRLLLSMTSFEWEFYGGNNIKFLSQVHVCNVCVFVCLLQRLLITCGMIWISYDWLTKFHICYMAAVLIINGRCGLRVQACCINQPNKSKLSLYKPLLLRTLTFFKQLYTRNKTEHFSYKGGCGVRGHTHVGVFNRRAGLGYR